MQTVQRLHTKKIFVLYHLISQEKTDEFLENVILVIPAHSLNHYTLCIRQQHTWHPQTHNLKAVTQETHYYV